MTSDVESTGGRYEVTVLSTPRRLSLAEPLKFSLTKYLAGSSYIQTGTASNRGLSVSGQKFRVQNVPAGVRRRYAPPAPKPSRRTSTFSVACGWSCR